MRTFLSPVESAWRNFFRVLTTATCIRFPRRLCRSTAPHPRSYGFEISLGGAKYKDLDRAFFSNRYGDNPGAASKVDAWQILSPVRDGLEGVDALNRVIQERFRKKWRDLAVAEGWGRKIPQPFGTQSIVYGDKVINIVNQKRFDVWPKPEGEAYLANGDLGVVVGQYKVTNAKFKGLPFKLEVEFAGQLGHKFGFRRGEFGDDAQNPLELAYALTVHKTQGSEFGVCFVVFPRSIIVGDGSAGVSGGN